jgi:catechol 2,3-dioxygenase-like lactoylglutathione lyase family enzyme
MTRFQSVAPVLPTRDVAASLALYAKLGFKTQSYEGPADYGYARRDDVYLHVIHAPHHDPRSTASTIYLYVEDADALHAEWHSAGVDGRFHEPSDTPYGLREGAYVDPDGNLLRYGSFLPGHGPRM